MPIQVQNIGDMCKNKWTVRDGLIEEKELLHPRRE